MSRLDNARKFRKEFEANKKASRVLIRKDELTADELLELIDVFDNWKVGLSVTAGERYKHNNQLYEVIQSHTTQADWEPQNVPALFKKVEPEGVLREIPETILATEAFMKGEKGTWKSKVYESLIDNNVWNPDVHASGWKLVG